MFPGTASLRMSSDRRGFARIVSAALAIAPDDEDEDEDDEDEDDEEEEEDEDEETGGSPKSCLS